MKDYEKTLRSLGYRRNTKGDIIKWLKPVGFTMFIFDEKNNTLSSYFFGNGTVTDLICWSSKVLDINDADIWIKIGEFEQYNLPSGPKYVNMAFTTEEEFINDILG